MRQKIPSFVIAVLSDVIPDIETHASLDKLFMYADAPGSPPDGSKASKVQEWLRRVNKDQSVDPLQILGLLIEDYMEGKPRFEVGYGGENSEENQERKQKIKSALTRAGLRYHTGGRISAGFGTPSRSLESILRERDLVSVEEEFDRALSSVEQNPREAVSAACNIVEATCKTYIEDEQLQMPKKKDLRQVWGVVRRDLRFDPSKLEERDLQEILTGLGAIVSGLASLRTHSSTAHAPGRTRYNIAPRHARLAVHAAHSLVHFLLETWEHRQRNESTCT